MSHTCHPHDGAHSVLANMVAHGADIHARDETRRGWSVLHFAAAGEWCVVCVVCGVCGVV